jgi:hypothetical protein
MIDTYKLIRDKSNAHNDFDEEVNEELLLHRQRALRRSYSLLRSMDCWNNSFGFEDVEDIARRDVYKEGYQIIPAENKVNHGMSLGDELGCRVCVALEQRGGDYSQRQDGEVEVEGVV